jgi:hypothetical protein
MMQVPYQYYTLAGTERSEGNMVHHWSLEDRLLMALSKAHTLTICNPTGCAKGGQKVNVPNMVAQFSLNGR